MSGRNRHGGRVLLLLTAVLFLVGGGFTSLWVGVIAGIAGTQIDAPLTWWRAHLPPGTARMLARLWPWVLVAYLTWAVASWLIAALVAERILRLTPLVTAVTPLLLVLILVTAFAHDVQPRTDCRRHEAARRA